MPIPITRSASWAAAFVRQALESDVLFEVQALAHTSRGVVTRTGDAPQRLDTFDPERVDVILVGGLDALSASDLTVLRRFADERGGTVILAPDATVPERVRQAFDLPPTAEKLLEKPIALAFGALSVRASEVLHAEQAVIRRGNVLIAAGLDAWRFRDDAFDAFWRAVVADGAAAAIPAMQVSVEPMLARPGDPLTVRARFRDFRAPISAAATLVPAVGPEVPVRLWPGMAAGEMRGTLNAPDEGQYDVRVNASGDIREAPLVIRRDARRPAVDRGAAIARVAETSGGAVFQASELSALNDRLRALPARDVERVARPMRSAGWALAFAVLLSGDWAWRRRRGLR